MKWIQGYNIDSHGGNVGYEWNYFSIKILNRLAVSQDPAPPPHMAYISVIAILCQNMSHYMMYKLV